MAISSKLKWFFRAEKINAVAFRALEMSIVQDLINSGKNPKEVYAQSKHLGYYLGDILLIAFHTQSDFVPSSPTHIPKFLRRFYVFLFGENPSRVSCSYLSKSNKLTIDLVSDDGFPTCRSIVSPHPEIKFGGFLVGVINRILDLTKEELGIGSMSIEEVECVSVGNEKCDIKLELEVLEPKRYRSLWGAECVSK